MTRCSWHRLCVGALSFLMLAVTGRAAQAQQTTSETPPPTQDDVLQSTLGLGAASGCFTLLGVGNNGGDVANALATAGNAIGNELRAICSPSAVTSASSLGGGLQSLQPVKTVTQFRLARSRIDQRLTSKPKPTPPPSPPPKPLKEVVSAWMQQGVLNPTAGLDFSNGAGIFGEIEFAGRDRATTAYERGYDSDVTGFSVGADYAGDGINVGGWFGRTHQDGLFTGFTPIFTTTGGDTPATVAVLGQPGVLTSVCGGLSDGGSFDQKGTQLGGFVGFGGAHGFVDGAFAWTRRDHDYTRSVCAIESQGAVTFRPGTGGAPGVLLDFNGNPLDDIFAGAINGVSRIDETSFSVRGGGDVGNAFVSGGPRAVFTVTRATTGAFVETGRSTVANRVDPVGAPPITRTLGGPVGLELSFDEQKRTSVLLEAGGEIAAHAGPVSPFFNGYWRHEFNDDFPVVTARMAQDRRTNPFVLRFGYDAYDRDAFQFGFGANAAAGQRFVARIEFTTLARDALFSGQTLSGQARVRF